jgi:Cdc6-like AAA superfamily ATPase
MANNRELETVTMECIDENLESTDKASTSEKLLCLPVQHFFVLLGVTSWTKRASGEIVQPVTTDQVHESYNTLVNEGSRVSERSVRDLVTDLETMGLVETWIQSKGCEGRVKQIETTFDPNWVQEVKAEYIRESPNLKQSE